MGGSNIYFKKWHWNKNRKYPVTMKILRIINKLQPIKHEMHFFKSPIFIKPILNVLFGLLHSSLLP